VDLITEVEATGDYQTYYVTVIAPAFFIIFFLVISILIRDLGTY
jgi:hypothetical protein